MKILQLYLFKRFIYGFLISLTVLLSIEIFFSFTAEIKHLNTGNYSFFKLLQYILLNIPRSINIMFPYAILIGEQKVHPNYSQFTRKSCGPSNLPR